MADSPACDPPNLSYFPLDAKVPVTPEANEQAILKVLTSEGAAYPARILEPSGRRLRLSLDGHPPPGAMVQIQGGDWSVLGEVIEFQEGKPALAVVEVEHLSLNARELECNSEVWFR